MKYEAVIGLEVHVQLGTRSKLFCACPTRFGCPPNHNTCPVCLGWPGSLPVLNEKALRLAIKVGLALECRVAERLKFDRKNYFYPDLPKAYQISQYDMPVNGRGRLKIEFKDAAGSTQIREIGITRAHLEEDAGKLLHEGIRDGSLVDYNRAGVPLLEIVSEPDLRTPAEVYAYLVSLKSILQYLEVSECNMEKGELRCDANVSIRPEGQTSLGTKAEIKNMNSFKAVEKAVEYEIERQVNAVDGGERIVQETRLWDEAKGRTFSMRSKEEAHDYRYFPEPDLVPFTISRAQVEEIRKTLPELPEIRTLRMIRDYSLSDYDAFLLAQEKPLADYYEACVAAKANPKLAANWIFSELKALLNERRLAITESPVSSGDLAGLIRLIEDGTVSGKIAKEILPEMFETRKSAEAIVKDKGLVQVTDASLIEALADQVLAAHPKSVADFRAGKAQALGFLVGQMMKESKGKMNPKLANEILVKKLNVGC
ncbi:MAG: Asp-tRNA(Asn)/Glu-tRNA(Gln) amidotransferase subunit GatB [Candidatus Omnitrophota bacterium]|jgi:aspartyl-tRNA(Asn)/glutamyl-tRNA(Gln) amidotransferase subunit B